MDAVQNTLSANGTTVVPGAHNGGPVYLQTSGNFGGGTLNVQVSYNGTNWTTIVSQTAEGFANFDIAVGALMRYVLSGATSPSIVVILR